MPRADRPGPGTVRARRPSRAPRLLGAHVSVAGGLHRAFERARDLGATAIQIFTKQPQRWAERTLAPEEVEAFGTARAASGVRVVAAHDSYLINLASPDPALFTRSAAAFRAELRRCARLGLDYLVTHPGNAIDGRREEAARRNARAVGEALEYEPGDTVVLLETTAGSGTSLGWRFEELAALVEAVPSGVRDRVGICLDTAHVHAAGWDLAGECDAMLRRLDETVGLARLRLLHLNDSTVERGARVDRHAHIGEGRIGLEGFAALLGARGLARVPAVIETPKEDDPATHDRRNLETLRRLAGHGDRPRAGR